MFSILTARTLTISLLLTIAVASVGSGLLLDKLYVELYSSEKTNRDLTDSQLEAIGAQLSTILQRLENKKEFVQAWHEEEAPLFLEVVNRDDIKMPKELLQILENKGHITLSSSRSLSYYYLLNDGVDYLVLRSPITSDNKQNIWLPTIFTAVYYALLMLVVFAWLFPLVRRLKRMQLSARQLGEGDLSARITPSVVSHIKDIEREFNRMAQRIEELVSDISLLSSAISHEMRAPLAKLQFGLDALREEADVETRRAYQDRLDKVIMDMTKLIETLLQYARLDKSIVQMPKDDVDLLELCTSLTTSIARGKNSAGAPESANLEINIKAEESLYVVKGDVFYINLLIDNLLSNAVKYGNGEILIGFDKSGNGTTFSIEDNGPGIDEGFRRDIFKPFMRWEEGMKYDCEQRMPKKGYGLGMALVKRIVDLHSVEITITESDTLGGSKITLDFL